MTQTLMMQQNAYSYTNNDLGIKSEFSHPHQQTPLKMPSQAQFK